MGQGALAFPVIHCSIEGLWRDVVYLQDKSRHVVTQQAWKGLCRYPD